MKLFTNILKVLSALAAVAGAVYVIATYGDKIVAWAKKLLASCPCKCNAEDCADCECELDCPVEEEVAEEEDVVAEEEVAEEAAEEEAAVEETAPVAEEADFEA